MAYEIQSWPTGSIITEEKLDHVEAGISDAATRSDVDDSIAELEASVDEKLETKISYTEEMELTPEQQTLARTNIGVGTSEQAVLYTPQELDAEQQTQARTNIGVGTADQCVLYSSQRLTDDQQAQARTNISALCADDIYDEVYGVVKYSEEQTLTEEEQSQARTNIGALGQSSIDEAVKAEADERADADSDNLSKLSETYNYLNGKLEGVSEAAEAATAAAETANEAAATAAAAAETANEAAAQVGEAVEAAAEAKAAAEEAKELVDELSDIKYSVSYHDQTLTEGEQSQARTNIGALSTATLTATYDEDTEELTLAVVTE